MRVTSTDRAVECTTTRYTKNAQKKHHHSARQAEDTMSDIDDYDEGHKHRSRRGVYDDEDDEEGSETYDSRRPYDDDDDDEEEEDEDENDDELRRDGFVVDDDDVEEEASEDEGRRRKKKKKKKRRHAERDSLRADDDDDDDALDEEDLALVAENTNQGSYAQSTGSRFKRLKRGTARRTIDDDDADDLRAELDDLVDEGGDEDRGSSRGRRLQRDAGYSDEDDGLRRGHDRMPRGGRRNEYDDDLGLFGNDDEAELPEDDYRSSRRKDRGRGDRHRFTRDGYEIDDGIDGDDAELDDDRPSGHPRRSYDDAERDGDDGVDSSRASGGQRSGAMASYFADSLDGIDDETWMELQDIFGDGEEYAFAMESTQGEQGAYKQKTLADVFEPAELEAKMMTQRDEDIRTTDIPERMLMRASGAEALRSLTEDEIEEETTWVVRQLHTWLVRQASIKSRSSSHYNNNSSGGWGSGGDNAYTQEPDHEVPSLFKQADFINERFLAAILSVLKLLSQDFYEVPYIARHRREVFVTPISPEDSAAGAAEQGDEIPTREWLSTDDLWKLYDFDEQFRGLLTCRRHLENMLRRLKGEGIDDGNEDSALGGSAISAKDQAYVSELIASASRVEDITDITEWVQMQYSEVIHSWKQQRAEYKRARNVGLWEQAKREGLDKFIDKVGITARQVGENISNPGAHFVEEHESSVKPTDVARGLVGTNFVSAEHVLKAGKSMLAHTLAADPQVRRFVRSYCDEHACVIVRPTERGRREITHEEHAAFAFKFLRQKPIAEFANDAQFIGIEKAEKEGLVRMEFSLTNEYKFDNRDSRRDDEVFDLDKERTARVISAQIEKHIKSDSVHEAADAWNKLRCDAVYTAVYEHLLPQMWREIMQKLHQQAFEFVADACRRSLERRIDVQPARNSRMLPGEKPRVAVVAGGGFDASSRGSLRIVYVNEHGKYVEYFSADSMRKSSGFSDSATNGDGIAPLLDLLSHQTIEVVAVAGMTLQTKRLFEDVQAVVSDHCSRSGDDIVVTYGNDEVARLWWDSDMARTEFPDLRKEERYCISVARTLQDPAIEYAALGKSIIHLPLHPAQRDVDQDALFSVVQRALVNVVNKVGVDINELAVYPHKQAILQYVSGLGPRKAQGIINKIGPGEKMLESRSDLIVKRLCTRTVFVNCASFLRIRPAAMDILDDTRIHPEDYELARKMALDALDIEDDDEEEDSGGRHGRRRADGPSRYVAEVMRRSPEKLDELDLVKYAEELKRLLDVHKLETLKFIKQEMQHPNNDPRNEFTQPQDKEILKMLTGEIVGETIREDGTSLVAGTVVRVQPRFAIARLDSGLEGFISIGNVADRKIDEVSDELVPGQTIAAVVKRIDLEKMSLDLSIRPSDIENVRDQAQQLVPDSSKVDRYFDADAESILRERAKAELQKSNARTRTIPHPLFKPFNGRQAEQYLASRPRGDCVIRPSSRGMDHIAITWKVGDGLFQHIDVKEAGKASDAALGTSLLIGDLAYSDLDELLALHIESISRKIDEVRRSSKFYDPESDSLYSAEVVEDVLGPNDYSSEYRSRRENLWETRVARHLDTLAQSTGRGSYCISLSLTKPGSLVLAFKPTPSYAGIQKWTARVEPNEFRLGERGRYPNVAGLINGFKMIQSKPATHGSGRGSGDDSRSRPHRPHGGSRWGDSRGDGRERPSRSGGDSSGGWAGDRPSSSRPKSGWGDAPSSSHHRASGTASGWDL
ncbi:hypothetical protein GQ54DRAFT_225732 [Martensiomyces pterosporus]|nr:hypothetical protein GQ54DRAFT_225732 [Martensiomyces pterosporus]